MVRGSGLAFPYTLASFTAALPLSFYIWQFYIKLWLKKRILHLILRGKNYWIRRSLKSVSFLCSLFMITQFKIVYFTQSQTVHPPHICGIHCFSQAFPPLLFFLLLLAIFMKGLNYLNHISSCISCSSYIICDLSLSAFWKALFDHIISDSGKPSILDSTQRC